ncbi:MAG: nuclear transport factor 2 family protein [Dehalococcoidia bacterium]
MDAAEVSRDYFAAYNARDTARLRRLLADAFRQVRAGGTLVIEGPDDYVAFPSRRGQRPDATIEIRRVVTTDSGALVEAV